MEQMGTGAAVQNLVVRTRGASIRIERILGIHNFPTKNDWL